MAAGHSGSTHAPTLLKQARMCEELIVQALRVLRPTFDVEIRRVRNEWEDWWTLRTESPRLDPFVVCIFG